MSEGRGGRGSCFYKVLSFLSFILFNKMSQWVVTKISFSLYVKIHQTLSQLLPSNSIIHLMSIFLLPTSHLPFCAVACAFVFCHVWIQTLGLETPSTCLTLLSEQEWSWAYGYMISMLKKKKCHSANLLGLYNELSSVVAVKYNSKKKKKVYTRDFVMERAFCVSFACYFTTFRNSGTSRNIYSLFSKSLSSWKVLDSHSAWCEPGCSKPALWACG